MNESTKTENNSVESEKPVQVPLEDNVKFPPFPEPTDVDFEDDITEEERNHYKDKFKDLNLITSYRIHCTACDRHLGCSARSETRLRPHPMLRTLMCHTCHTFYNSGEFEKGDDGSELYCRWCGQGGQVYCCSTCPHVFCAKCIKRNLGTIMIKEIEETDDWKCFKCNSKYLWDLRALCWAVLRYCDLKNRITYATQDPTLKEVYQKDCALDLTTCCKNKTRKKAEEKKPKQKEESKKNTTTTAVTKIPSTIQVKKFASLNLEDTIIKLDKKPQKRPASPKNKPIVIKNPLAMGPKILTPVIMPPIAKKMRMSNPSMINPVRFNNDRKQANTYSRIRPQPPIQQIMFNGYNSNTPFNQMVVSDNINLSLESLTQGLDMATVAGMANNSQDNDVVCTPDFPLEPLCEVTEDANDDDVQCIGPVLPPKVPPPLPPPPLVPRNMNVISSLSTDNIIQMTENDVTVNSVTGGLKFRVDPQTLSSNKMYRLPDGRIFAINANPNMPGGYSATIVAVTDDAVSKMPPKGATYAAKLSSVGNQLLTPPPLKEFRNQIYNRNKSKRSTPKTTKSNKRTETPTRDCDLNVPVEWFRYNVIDAVDAVEYSLSRLSKLKQETTTMFLRTRSVTEMRNLHKRLDRLLNTSACRFNEIRENINKEFKQYLLKKIGGNTSEDDDDVEILHDDHDDPIFIDENSMESNVNESQEVDLTVLGSSDQNDSSEKSPRHQDSYNDDTSVLPVKTIQNDNFEKPESSLQESILPDNPHILKENANKVIEKQSVKTNNHDFIKCDDNDNANGETDQTVYSAKNIVSEDSKNSSTNVSKDIDMELTDLIRDDNNPSHKKYIVSKDIDMELTDFIGDDNNPSNKKHVVSKDIDMELTDFIGDDNNPSNKKHVHSVEYKKGEDILKDGNAGQYLSDKKTDDSEMSEEMIENLLKDDPGDNIVRENLTAMDVPA